MRHKEFAKHMLIFVGLVMSSLSFVMAVPGIGQATTALDFDGIDAYVTFGSASSLGLAEFTIECWFKREGTGSNANTGTGGLLGIPLVTKGVGEGDGSNVDMNYFLGIRSSDNVLAADFEEAPGGPGPAGQNHPVFGTTPIPVDPSTWHHAAATYDGTTWRLYLDGNLEAELTLAAGVTPRSDSIQHAGLAAALNSNGARSGLFEGVIDEVRIWDHARTLLDIQSSINSEISGPASGLVARWGLNEGIGTVRDCRRQP